MGDQTTPAPVTVPEPEKPLTEQEILAQLHANYKAFINDKDVQALMDKAEVKAAQIRVPSDPEVQKLPNKSTLRQTKFSKLTKEQQELVTRANEQGLAVVIPVGGKDFGFMPTKEQREAAAKKTNTSDTDARAQAEDEKKSGFGQWWDDNSWWLKPVIFFILGTLVGGIIGNALNKNDTKVASDVLGTVANKVIGNGDDKEDSNTNTNGGDGGKGTGGDGGKGTGDDGGKGTGGDAGKGTGGSGNAGFSSSLTGIKGKGDR